jgi:predicted MFS family arabinose efflux permease
MESQEHDWPMWAWVCLAASLPVLWAFYLYEQRLSNKNLSLLIDPRLFKDRGFVVGLIVICIYFAGHTSMLLVLNLYLQFSLSLDPMDAGFSFVPLSGAFLIGSTFSGKLQGYLGRDSLHLGIAVLAIGIASLALQAKAVPDHLTFSFLATCFLYGIGRGIVTSPLYNTVLGNIPTRDAGAASGAASTMQSLASSIGVAVIGAVVSSVIPKQGATPTDYAHGFVVSSAVNMAMLLIAGLLIFFIPKSRSCDLPADDHVIAEG